MLKNYNEVNLNHALFYKTYTLPSTTIALHWAGLISYYADRPVYDVLGKSDKHIAKLKVNNFAPGHSKWDWDYIVNEKKPDILINESRGLGDRGDFRAAYLTVTRGNEFLFFIRREAVVKLDAPSLVLGDIAAGRRVRIEDFRQP